MARAADQQAAELRRVIDQQITNLETAIAISEKASQEDAAVPDGDPFAAVSAGDVIQVIADARAAGKINDCVIYMLAKFTAHELENQLRQQKKLFKKHGATGGNSKQTKWAAELGFPSPDELKLATLTIWDRDYNGRLKKEVHDAEVAAVITRNGSGKVTLKPSTVTAWRRERDKKAQSTP